MSIQKSTEERIDRLEDAVAQIVPVLKQLAAAFSMNLPSPAASGAGERSAEIAPSSLSVTQAAKRAGASPNIIYLWCTQGLAHFRVGCKGKRGRIRILLADLDAFIASLKTQKGREAVKPPAPRKKVILSNLQMPN